jgi:multidrug resistance protein, MATE family
VGLPESGAAGYNQPRLHDRYLPSRRLIFLQNIPLTVQGGIRRRLADESYRRVLALAMPAVAEQLLNMTVGLVDTFMVGHLGAQAVAAVGLSNQAVMLVTTFFAAVATGVTALVARHTGAHEPAGANAVLRQGYLLGVILGLIGTVAGVALAGPTMLALQAPADVVAPGTIYLGIVSLSFFLAALMFIGNAALRGAGDTRAPMMIMLVVNAINIVVAYVAIHGLGPLPAFGVAGSAIGAVAARSAGGVIVTVLLIRGRGGVRLDLRRLRPDTTQIKRILNVGLPAGAEQLLMRFAQTAFAVTVASLGTQAYAAHQLALQSESLSFMPGFGFAVAATTLAGQGLGAQDPRRARADATKAWQLGVLTMALMGAFFFVFATQLIQLFIDDPVVVALGVNPLRLEAFSEPALATAMVLAGALRGAGDTRSTLVITSVGLWLVRLPLALVLVHSFGLMGAWMAMGVDINLRALALWLRFRSDHWTKIKV